MKRGLLFICCFLAFLRLGEAHEWTPPGLGTVAASGDVYLVKVVSDTAGPDSVHPAKIHFTVTEVLRGQTESSFTLAPYSGEAYKTDSEWILVHNPGGFKDCVGWAIKGDCEWLPIPLTRDGDQATAKWIGPLDQVRDYLRQHPKKI